MGVYLYVREITEIEEIYDAERTEHKVGVREV
jgi:hypothetical protein